MNDDPNVTTLYPPRAGADEPEVFPRPRGTSFVAAMIVITRGAVELGKFTATMALYLLAAVGLLTLLS